MIIQTHVKTGTTTELDNENMMTGNSTARELKGAMMAQESESDEESEENGKEREELAKVIELTEVARGRLTKILEQLDLKQRALARVNEDLQYLARAGMAYGRSGGVEGAYWAGRRSVVYELQESGKLSEARLGLEIIWLLPAEFVKFYSELFHRALKADSGRLPGASGGNAVEKGTTGTVLGSEQRNQASGSGKRYKNTPLVIGSERAFKVKEALDKVLLDGVGLAKKTLERKEGSKLRKTADGEAVSDMVGQCKGRIAGPDGKVDKDSPRCTRFLKAAWQFCPTCGTKRG